MTGAQRGFQIHAAAWTAVNSFLFMIWLIATPGEIPWFLFPAGGWGIGLAIHATAVYTKAPRDDDELEAGEGRAELGYRP